jgi:hypothetical protein
MLDRTFPTARARFCAAATAALAVLGGCFNPGAESHLVASDTGAAASRLVGGFEVRLVSENPANGTRAHAFVLGSIKDGPEPQPFLWHVRADDGTCRLLESEAPHCATPCDADSICTGHDACTPYPKAVAVDDVSLSGISEYEIGLELVAGRYVPADTQLAFPPCVEGDTIALHASGSPAGAFSLQTRCIAPLELDAPERIEPGQVLRLAWPRAGQPELARIGARLDVSYLGGTRSAIECEVEDGGELVIARELLDGLVELGTSGISTVSLTRLSRTERRAERMDIGLSMLQTVERRVVLPGTALDR